LAHTFLSPCLSCEFKVKVATQCIDELKNHGEGIVELFLGAKNKLFDENGYFENK
jgi:hypothetical protein